MRGSAAACASEIESVIRDWLFELPCFRCVFGSATLEEDARREEKL